MDNLKIKVSLGSFNVELEGKPEDVKQQFEEIKKNGLGQMVDQLVPVLSVRKTEESSNILTKNVIPESIDLVEEIVDNLDNPNEISLFDLATKGLPKAESEWILVYGHYFCYEGNKSFTRKDLVDKYETSERKNQIRMKNLSRSIKIANKKGWISEINKDLFVITPDGREKVQEIFKRKEGTFKTSKRNTSKKEVEIKDNE